MGFGWLHHLRAAGTPLAAANARALTEEWLGLCGRPTNVIAWRPEVAARRLLSWLSHSPLVLDAAELAFYRRFMRAIGRHTAWLSGPGRTAARGETRLLVAIALAEAALCSNASEARRKKTTRLLVRELNRQIRLDGGHIGRNPRTLIDLSLDLLPLRQAYVARSIPVPPELNNAIDRMMPMLRLFRHGDGALGLFNGMSQTPQDELSTVFAYDDARALPLMNAIATGYQRLEAAETCIICDTGAPPPPEFSTAAHAGALSFEMSSGAERIIVNCGAPQQDGPVRQAARLTAAHSTLVVADTSSCRFAGTYGADAALDGCIISGPRHVHAGRHDTNEWIAIAASHDGYVRTFGLVHERSLRLSLDGMRIEGVDVLKSAGRAARNAVSFAIRFHLHPQMRAAIIENGQGALIVTPNGRQWIFHATGRPVAIEESAFFASPEGTRATTQIVVPGQSADGARVEWVLMRRD